MANANSIPIPPRTKDITGQVFSRVTVLSYAEYKAGCAWWLCRCTCGKELTISGAAMRNGRTRSCGCLQRDRTVQRCTTHDMYKSPEYSSWRAMVERCTNPSHRAYRNYGERGITVDKRWLDSFAAFYADVGARPSPKHTLDRINNAKGYTKGNCRWATRKEQQWNMRTNHILTFRNESLCVGEWADRLGISDKVIRSRLRRGWSVERTLGEPIRVKPI